MTAIAMLALSVTAMAGATVLLACSLMTDLGPHPFVPSATLFAATYSALIWLRDYVRDLR